MFACIRCNVFLKNGLIYLQASKELLKSNITTKNDVCTYSLCLKTGVRQLYDHVAFISLIELFLSYEIIQYFQGFYLFYE